MNVGIVTTWHEGGAGYVSRGYMNVLAKQGNAVHIYARGGRFYPYGDPNWDLSYVTPGKRYVPFRFTRFGIQYIDMLHFESWLRRHDIHILIFNEEIRFHTVKRVRQLGYIVGAYIDYYEKDNVEQFKAYDFLLCNTRRHYSVFCDFANCFYIPWGTDIQLFKPKPDEGRESRNNEVVLFHSAGWRRTNKRKGTDHRKGTDLVLSAFPRVRGKARLIVHSQAPLSQYGNASAEIVKRDGRIQFIEKTVPAPGLYHLADVFVYPSRLEGIGLCVPEALACGLPVITTDNAPMNEFVEDGVNGLLVRVKETRTREDGYYWPEKIADIDDLARKMQVYVDDRGLLTSHKAQARARAEERLDWTKNASELTHSLQSVIIDTDRRRRPRFGEQLQWWSEAKYVAFMTCARRVARKAFRRV